MFWRYFTWRHGGGLIVGDDLPAGRPADGLRGPPGDRPSDTDFIQS